MLFFLAFFRRRRHAAAKVNEVAGADGEIECAAVD